MTRHSFHALKAYFPLVILLTGCAPIHDIQKTLTQQPPASYVDSALAEREQANGLILQGQWLDASIQLTSALGGGYHHS
nr:hypothetical protein [Citrobacter farmeri]